MTRLIWVFAGRTLILLVLSCRGSCVMTILKQQQQQQLKQIPQRMSNYIASEAHAFAIHLSRTLIKVMTPINRVKSESISSHGSVPAFPVCRLFLFMSIEFYGTGLLDYFINILNFIGKAIQSKPLLTTLILSVFLLWQGVETWRSISRMEYRLPIKLAVCWFTNGYFISWYLAC